MRPTLANLPINTCRVLLVDDDPVNLVLLSGLLAMEGYALETATSGEEALEKSLPAPPDLVVLDIHLPGIDGLETCRRLQARHGSESPPVIFATARNSQDDIVAGFAAGGVDYLVKPISGREAIARIRTHLSNRVLVRQLGDALSHKNRLLGMAAHDLRNPLSTIKALAELLCEGALGGLQPEQAEVTSTIRDASREMLDLVNELLDVSVIESGQLRLAAAPADLAVLVSKAVRFNNINAARKGTSIHFIDTSGAACSRAVVDAPKINQVVNNLLTNAVKYSPPGSTVTVSLAGTDGHVILAVRDQGPGIPEQERSRLFKEFSTLSVRSTAGEKSTGLGLAICRRIVEAHHGTIEAANLQGGGCEFSVTLPLVPPA